MFSIDTELGGYLNIQYENIGEFLQNDLGNLPPTGVSVTNTNHERSSQEISHLAGNFLLHSKIFSFILILSSVRDISLTRRRKMSPFYH